MADPDTMERVIATPLGEALSERYLAYALSTIVNRALPDARDGLKPVQRRILYAMRELKLDPASGFKKCARVVGEVIGKYHPHGETAIYDAMVRLAQGFAVRYPLVDGQGNFGNVDGDNAAAMRYTEARLTEVALALLDGIDEDAVDFRDNYDGEEEEPVVLPGGFPNLLANGAQGIAVGMACSIPPHNAHELIDAALHLIKHPQATTEKLVDLVPGPDFPTGGVIVEPRAAIVEAYATGRGGFRLRAQWGREDQGRGTYQIVVTEIPYQVQKSRLIEKIAELLAAKKAPLLADVRDESADDIRLVLEPKSRTVDADALMESLFRLTDLEVRVPLNLNVLDAHNTPAVRSLRECLTIFLAHRREVLQRRTRHRLAKIEKRLETLAGYLIAYLNLDEVIRIIREEDEPKRELMAAFNLTDAQAEAILNMRLRSLRRLEEMEIVREHEALTEEKGELEALLASEEAQWGRVADELRAARDKFGKKTPLGARRSQFSEAPAFEEVDPEAFIEREPITVIVSEKGWIRARAGHLAADQEIKYKEGDGPRFLLHAQTTDRLLLFGANGRFYTIPCDKLPGGRGMGEPIRLICDLPNDGDMVALRVHRPGAKLLIAASDGRGFVIAEDEAIAQTRAGKQALNLPAGVVARVATPADGDRVAVVGENRKLLIFPLGEISEMTRGRGVVLQKYRDGGLSDAKTFKAEAGLTWRDSSGRKWSVSDLRDWEGKRAGAGRLPPRGFPRDNRFGG